MLRGMLRDPAAYALEWFFSALVIALLLVFVWSMFRSDDDDLPSGWGKRRR